MVESTIPRTPRCRRRPPGATIYPYGSIALNTAAYRLLGKPDYVAVSARGDTLELRARETAADARCVSIAGVFSCMRIARLVYDRLGCTADRVQRIRLPGYVESGVLRIPLRLPVDPDLPSPATLPRADALPGPRFYGIFPMGGGRGGPRRWIVRMRLNYGREYYVGEFETASDARLAYRNARRGRRPLDPRLKLVDWKGRTCPACALRAAAHPHRQIRCHHLAAHRRRVGDPYANRVAADRSAATRSRVLGSAGPGARTRYMPGLRAILDQGGTAADFPEGAPARDNSALE